MVKKVIDILITSKLLFEFDNLVGYLNFIRSKYRDNNLDVRISRVMTLINQIKQACYLLHNELRFLRSDLQFIFAQKENNKKNAKK